MENLLNQLKNQIPFLNKFLKTHKNEESIDIKTVFNSKNIDIQPILRKVLKLAANFPNNLIQTPNGHKYNELEIFTANMDSSIGSGQEPVKAFFDIFNTTQTQLGTLLLQNLILNPITDTQILTARQNTIKTILDSGELENILLVVTELTQIEHDVIGLLTEDTEEMQEIYKVVYFESRFFKWLNYNELGMRIFYFFVILFTPLYGIISPVMVLIVPFIFLRYFLKVPLAFGTFWSIMKGFIFGGNTGGVGITSIISKLIGTILGLNSKSQNGGGPNGVTGVKWIVLWLIQKIIEFLNSSIGSYIYIGFFVLSYVWGIYNTFVMSSTYNKIINVFHGKLNKLRVWVSSSISFYNMVCSLGISASVISTDLHNRIKTVLRHPTIVLLLERELFNNSPSLFSNKGIILKVYREFLDCKEKCVELVEPLCELVGCMDMWCSLAKWYITGSAITANCKSFCEYLGDDKPKVVGTDIWNICCTTPICNDVCIGTTSLIPQQNSSLNCEETIHPDSVTDDINTDIIVVDATSNSTAMCSISNVAVITTSNATINPINTNNLLITGPNSSGKSTYIKSIIECILLGQTVGIVPAKQFQFTPFHHITTYLNIPDCQGKESLFQAEMNRCYQQLQLLENAESRGERTFSIMDEIFVSTNYQEGMSGFYAIIKKLCKFDKCLNVITTHFDVLARMDDINIDKKYFDIELDEEKDKIVKDYKVKNGVSRKHMALKLLKRKGFDSEIINDAEYFYNKLVNSGEDSGEGKDDIDKKNTVSVEEVSG